MSQVQFEVLRTLKTFFTKETRGAAKAQPQRPRRNTKGLAQTFVSLCGFFGCLLRGEMRHCLNVATRAVQFALPLSVKEPANCPAAFTTSLSFAPREWLGGASCCSRTNPEPAATVCVLLAGNPVAANTSSWAEVVRAVSPLLATEFDPWA